MDGIYTVDIGRKGPDESAAGRNQKLGTVVLDPLPAVALKKCISAIIVRHLPRNGALPLPTGDVSYNRVTATVQQKGDGLFSCSLDPLSSNLPPVQPNQPGIFHAVQVFTPLNLLVADRKDNLYVAWMSLVGVNASMGTVRPPTGFLTRNSESAAVFRC